MSQASSPVVGGQAVALEYSALLGMPVSEATIRKVVRYNPAVRDALRAALRELPEVAAAAPDSTLERAAELSRGEDSQKQTGALYAALCPAAQQRVIKALNLPSYVKTWEVISARCRVYGSELLANCIVVAENNAEALSQRPDALREVEQRFARLSETGQRKVIAKATTYGEAAVSFEQIANYAKTRGEAAELAAIVGAQLAKERGAEAKKRAAAALKAPTNPPATPLHTKAADPHSKRTTNHRYRRASAGKV